MSGIAGPALIRQIEKGKEYKYVSEAKMVYETMSLYMLENVTKEKVMDFYVNVSAYSFDDPQNVMYEILGGVCSDNARIPRLSIDFQNISLKAIVYQAGGYQIEIRNGELDECKKVGLRV